jgi:O-antigen/teichoic acid export membrane protein
MTSSLRRNSLWLLLARLTAQALAIIFIAITARKLALHDFGHFAFIASVLLIGNTFTNFGTDTFLVRDIARAGHVTQIASQALSLQLVLSVCFYCALIFYRDPPLLLYALALFPLALFSVNTALLRALDRMDLFWLLALANGIVQVVAAYLSSDVSTLCLFLLAGQLWLSVFSILICSARLPDFTLFPLKDFRPIFKLALPFAVLTILLVFIQRLGILSVSTLLGDAATGLFSSATRVVDGLKFGHYAILGALLPALSRGTQVSWVSFRRAFFLLMIASLVFAVALAIFANSIIVLLYGKEFLLAAGQLSFLGWSLLPYTISSFISYNLIARGLEYTLVKATVVSLITYVALYFWFIHSYRLTGAVWAALIGECMQAIVFSLFYLKSKSNSNVLL